MAVPRLDAVERPIVGRSYLVPCILVDVGYRTAAVGRQNGWVPVHGPKHTDREHIEFPLEHWHIDWRFAYVSEYRAACSRAFSKTPLAVVISADTAYQKLTREPELRPRRCLREMPVFPIPPQAPSSFSGTDSRTRWARLERAQAFTCNKLKPGNICPHRGIDLTAFRQPDGTAICPGHGLRWNLETGELMPRMAK